MSSTGRSRLQRESFSDAHGAGVDHLDASSTGRPHGRTVSPWGTGGEAGATPPADLPRGPDFFRFFDDEAFAAALREQGLASPAVADIAFAQRFADADELWDGMLGATVRVAALITSQPAEVRQRIHAAFDRLAEGYRRGDGLELPVAMKLATASKPDPG